MKLSDSITTIKGIGPKKGELLKQNGIDQLEDFLHFFPRKYEDRREVTAIKDVEIGKECLIVGKVLSRKYSGNPYKKNTPLTLLVSDDTGTVEVVFFNGRYIANLFNINQEYSFYGKATISFDRMQMIHPEFHRLGAADDVRGIIPIYPQISGISQHEIRKIQGQIRELYPQVEEWLPKNIVENNRLASPAYALEHIHFPKDGNQVLESKFRLIFDELLTLETGLFYIKNETRKDTGGIIIDPACTQEFLSALPFNLTKGQEDAWEDIKKDLSSEKVMNRLIQGDVGSGKTVIAELTMFAAAKNGFQSIMMAPTEILAKQHFQSLSKSFAPFGVTVGFLSSSMKAAEKKQVLHQLKEGEIQILVGTHAIIEPGVQLANLGVVITDEQHRFGVNQRSLLAKKGENPNVLVMTATPIPRTLAVVLYGDLDISQIRTMPEGRIPIKTIKGNVEDRRKIYNFVKSELEAKKQAYVVAPLIEESDKIDATSVETLYKELSTKLKEHKVALLHGNMKQEEKDSLMNQFASGAIDVLVSTIVIEVGINVPNATVMVIENSERFGLAQLHQLRGRVGRGKDQSYCFLVCHHDSDLAVERNKIMCQTNDGFEIAEADLNLRGPGEIFGTRQHGLPELQISDLIRHGDVLEKAKDIAKEIIDQDPNLKHPEFQGLKRRIRNLFGEEIKLEL
ncbi:ATP-dependent DNA helicase RecG [Clostridiales Family XIII bacterium PM5-7]